VVYAQRVRLAMQDGTFDQLTGTVESGSKPRSCAKMQRPMRKLVDGLRISGFSSRKRAFSSDLLATTA
jgi:hypothetical protein